MITIIAPFLIAVLGLLLYILATNPKVQEIGRIMFACGMLVLTWILSNHVYHLG